MFVFYAYVMYCCYTTVLSSIMSNKLFLKLKLKLNLALFKFASESFNAYPTQSIDILASSSNLILKK